MALGERKAAFFSNAVDRLPDSHLHLATSGGHEHLSAGVLPHVDASEAGEVRGDLQKVKESIILTSVERGEITERSRLFALSATHLRSRDRSLSRDDEPRRPAGRGIFTGEVLNTAREMKKELRYRTCFGTSTSENASFSPNLDFVDKTPPVSIYELRKRLLISCNWANWLTPSQTCFHLRFRRKSVKREVTMHVPRAARRPGRPAACWRTCGRNSSVPCR